MLYHEYRGFWYGIKFREFLRQRIWPHRFVTLFDFDMNLRILVVVVCFLREAFARHCFELIWITNDFTILLLLRETDIFLVHVLLLHLLEILRFTIYFIISGCLYNCLNCFAVYLERFFVIVWEIVLSAIENSVWHRSQILDFFLQRFYLNVGWFNCGLTEHWHFACLLWNSIGASYIPRALQYSYVLISNLWVVFVATGGLGTIGVMESSIIFVEYKSYVLVSGWQFTIVGCFSIRTVSVDEAIINAHALGIRKRHFICIIL